MYVIFFSVSQINKFSFFTLRKHVEVEVPWMLIPKRHVDFIIEPCQPRFFLEKSFLLLFTTYASNYKGNIVSMEYIDFKKIIKWR